MPEPVYDAPMTLERLWNLTWEQFAVVIIVETDAGAIAQARRRGSGESCIAFRLSASAWADLQDDVRSRWVIESSSPLLVQGIAKIGNRSCGVLMTGESSSPQQIILRYGVQSWNELELRSEDQRIIVLSFLKRFRGSDRQREEARRLLIDALRVYPCLESFDLEDYALKEGWSLGPPDPYDFELNRSIEVETQSRFLLDPTRSRRRIRNAVLIEACEDALKTDLTGEHRRRLEEDVRRYRITEDEFKRRDDIEAGAGQAPFQRDQFIGALARLEGQLAVLDVTTAGWNGLETVREAIIAVVEIAPMNQWGYAHDAANVSCFLEIVEMSLSRWRGELTMPPSRVVIGELINHAEVVWSNSRNTEWDRGAETCRGLLYQAKQHIKRDLFGNP